MSSNLVILGYKKQSAGAKALEQELKRLRASNAANPNAAGVKVQRSTWQEYEPQHINQDYVPSYYRNATFINWGDTSNSGLSLLPHAQMNNSRILNNWIKKYSDKKSFFVNLADNDFIPKFFTNKTAALNWIAENPNRKLCVRTKLRASGGDGLSIYSYEDFQNGVFCPDAPLYVEYKRKKHEFRYHFFQGAGGFLQQKRLRHGTENKNFEIRNHENNWVFCRDNVDDIPAVRNLCEKLKSIAVFDWGLNFGAFDLIYNEAENKAYALEINTAPGLEGQSVKDYGKFFWDYHMRNTLGVA